MNSSVLLLSLVCLSCAIHPQLDDEFLEETNSEMPVAAPYWLCNSSAPCAPLDAGESGEIVLDEFWAVRAGYPLPYPPSLRVVVNPQSQSASRKCLFLPDVTNDPLTFWGDALSGPLLPHLDCRYIYLLRTSYDVQDGWRSRWLQQVFVRAIREFQYSASQPSSTKIFAHGFANLVLAGAIMNSRFATENGTCAYGRDGVAERGGRVPVCRPPQWFMIAGPLAGMRAVDTLCSRSVPGASAEWLRGDRCVAEKQTHRAILSAHPDNPPLSLGDVQRTVYRYLAGAMCGVSSVGLGVPPYSAVLALVANASHATPLNDGLVDVASCAAAVDFSVDWATSMWYLAEANHLDLTGRNGEPKSCALLNGLSRLNVGYRERRRCVLQWYQRAVQSFAAHVHFDNTPTPTPPDQ